MKRLILIGLACMTLQFVKAQTPDTIVLNDKIIYFLNSQFNNVNYKTCDEQTIVDYINGSDNVQSYTNADEFQKRKIISVYRDSLDYMQKQYSFNNIYTFSNRRLFGDYDFDKHLFPIVGSYFNEPRILSYPEMYKYDGNGKVYHIAPVDLSNTDRFPLEIKMSEDDAQALIKLKKDSVSSMLNRLPLTERNFQIREGIKYVDELHNFYGNNEDRRVFLTYYVRFVNNKTSNAKSTVKSLFKKLTDNGRVVEQSNNNLTAEIIRIDFYLFPMVDMVTHELTFTNKFYTENIQ